MFICGNPYTGTGDARYPENIKLSATSNTRCSKSNVLSVGESLFTPPLTHGVLDNLQQEIVEVTNVEMVSGTKQYTRSDRPISTSLVYFRVLDLRVRYRLVNGKKIRPYCVLRLGNRHHRSGAFPAEGLQVHSRRTTVDDRQVSGGKTLLFERVFLLVLYLCTVSKSIGNCYLPDLYVYEYSYTYHMYPHMHLRIHTWHARSVEIGSHTAVPVPVYVRMTCTLF